MLIVLSNNPPVNALGAAVRQGLVAAIEQAEGDDSVKALVIACEGQTFFAGADVSEFGTPQAFEQPMLPQVVDRSKLAPSQSSPRSTARRWAAVSRSHSSCHYRVAVPSAEIRPAGSEAGFSAGRGWDAASAAGDRRQQGAGDVRNGQSNFGPKAGV